MNDDPDGLEALRRRCATPTITVQPTQYMVTMLPPDSADATVWSLSIEWCGRPMWNAPDHPADKVWAVRRMGRCLSRTGRWVWEPQPSSRTPTFYKRHRFTFEEAVEAAKREVPKIVVNGMSALDILYRPTGLGL